MYYFLAVPKLTITHQSEKIQELQRHPKPNSKGIQKRTVVAMVGDGINDAPVRLIPCDSLYISHSFRP